MKKIILLLLIYSTCLQAQPAQNEFTDIVKTLDSCLFVNRFESIETSCLVINESNNAIAIPERDVINSNYRIQATKGKIDSNGVKCLSQYCARYIRLFVTSIDPSTLCIEGNVQHSYAYPAGDIIQYLGFAYNKSDPDKDFFNRLIRSTGTFSAYPEGDKYRIRLTLTDGPFDKRDTIFGYIEVAKEGYRNSTSKVFSIFFDRMSLYKGDKNNQIFLKFSSTSHWLESEYYSYLLYSYLKENQSRDILKRANALWLDNFFKNEKCPQCKPVYNSAVHMLNSHSVQLPNTEPIPAH